MTDRQTEQYESLWESQRFNRKQVPVFYLSFSFCSFSFLSFSALASSASCFLMSSSTSFCLRTLILVLPFSRVSVAISTLKMDRKREQLDICP